MVDADAVVGGGRRQILGGREALENGVGLEEVRWVDNL